MSKNKLNTLKKQVKKLAEKLAAILWKLTTSMLISIIAPVVKAGIMDWVANHL